MPPKSWMTGVQIVGQHASWQPCAVARCAPHLTNAPAFSQRRSTSQDSGPALPMCHVPGPSLQAMPRLHCCCYTCRPHARERDTPNYIAVPDLPLPLSPTFRSRAANRNRGDAVRAAGCSTRAACPPAADHTPGAARRGAGSLRAWRCNICPVGALPAPGGHPSLRDTHVSRGG